MFEHVISDSQLFALSEQSRLEKYIEVEQPELKVRNIVRLTGDASTRHYFRIYLESHNLIAAVYKEPFTDSPFCDVTELLQKASLPVPKLFAVSGKYAVILQEDLGDTRLQDWLITASTDELKRAYFEAIDLIVGIQSASELAIKTNSISSKLAFDKEKLMWELEFFYKHFFNSYLQLEIPASETEKLIGEFTSLSQELAAKPRVLCHRDYHSRNLMMAEGKIYIIDHQDARMGPRNYDLASLLRDPYVKLDEGLVWQLYDFYIERIDDASRSRDEMMEEFDLMTVQRITKAIGTYAYQAAIVKNSIYEQYIDPAIKTVIASSERIKKFPILREMLRKQLRVY